MYYHIYSNRCNSVILHLFLVGCIFEGGVQVWHLYLGAVLVMCGQPLPRTTSLLSEVTNDGKKRDGDKLGENETTLDD